MGWILEAGIALALIILALGFAKMLANVGKKGK